MSEHVTCPDCKGRKQSVVYVCGPNTSGMRIRDCSTCQGTGVVSAELAARIVYGKKVRDYRVHVREETGNEVADRIGVDRVAYNHFEHGRDILGSMLRTILAEVSQWGIEGGNPWNESR